MTTQNNPLAPQDQWESLLRIFRWAIRIPICLVLLFAVTCAMIVGSILIFRVTAWMIGILS